MRKYETVVILSPDLNEAQVKQEITKFENILKAKGASVKVDNGGRRELAYSIAKTKTGVFVTFGYEASDYGCVEALTSILRITDSVVKFQSHKINERPRKFKGNPKRPDRGEGFDEDFGDSMEMEY